jgi:hypothetical protein
VRQLLREAQSTYIQLGIPLYRDSTLPSDDLPGRLQRDINTYIYHAKNGQDEAVNHRAKPENWWKVHHKKMPCLAPLVRIFLSIQASSAASERLFSLAGRRLTRWRSLQATRLRIMVLLSAWDQGYNNDVDTDGEGYNEDDEGGNDGNNGGRAL